MTGQAAFAVGFVASMTGVLAGYAAAQPVQTIIPPISAEAIRYVPRGQVRTDRRGREEISGHLQVRIGDRWVTAHVDLEPGVRLLGPSE